MTEKCANQIGLSSVAAAPAFRSLVSSSAISPDSLRCSNHTNERKNVSEDIQTPSLTHHRTRHPDFLPRLPGKTTTPINSNLNPQKTKLMGDETETAATAAFMLSADTKDHNAW